MMYMFTNPLFPFRRFLYAVFVSANSFSSPFLDGWPRVGEDGRVDIYDERGSIQMSYEEFVMLRKRKGTSKH